MVAILDKLRKLFSLMAMKSGSLKNLGRKTQSDKQKNAEDIWEAFERVINEFGPIELDEGNQKMSKERDMLEFKNAIDEIQDLKKQLEAGKQVTANALFEIKRQQEEIKELKARLKIESTIKDNPFNCKKHGLGINPYTGECVMCEQENEN